MSAETASPFLAGRLRPLLALLQPRFGARLRAVVAHGPDVTGRPANGPLPVFILVDALSAEDLLPLAADLTRLRRSGLIPTFMASEDVARSLDVFPLEFLDMRANYTVAHGDDPLAGLTFERAPLRLQLEEALRGLISHFRQLVAAEGHRPKRLRAAMGETLPSLVPVLRAMLLLERGDVPADVGAMWQAAAEAFAIDRTRLERLSALVAGAERPEPPELWTRVTDCDALLAALLRRVDEWDVS